MATYEVELHDRHGLWRHRAVVRAAEPWDAVADARALLPETSDPDDTYVVFQQRRLRRRRTLLRVRAGGPWGAGGDGAGVREPRRPKPGPGHLSAEADLP
jgi:hypothetical protein